MPLDSGALSDIHAEIVRVVRRHGGVIDGSAVIGEIDGDFRVQSVRGDGLLARVPQSMLIPVGACEWGSEQGAIRWSERQVLDDSQRELLALMVAFYNAAEKLAWYRTCHPRGALDDDGSVAVALRDIRPGWHADDTVAGFLRTRTLDIVPPGGDTATPSLMPFIDLMNHHSDAPPYRTPQSDLEVDIWHPPGSDECAVRYRAHSDALDLALQYGFIDHSAHAAYSMPTSVPLEGIGRLAIAGLRPRAQVARRFPTVTSDQEGVTLSHVLVDERRAADACAAIRLPILAAARTADLPADVGNRLAERAIQGVADANNAALARLAEVAGDAGGPAAELIAHAAGLQARRFNALSQNA